MAVSAARMAVATAVSLAVHWLIRSFLQAQHPALGLLFPTAVFIGIAASGNVAGAANDAPPGPPAVPVFGNWLQVGNDLNHRFLARLSARYGPVFRLRLGVRNLVVVSDPRLATEVLHTQGVEFGSVSTTQPVNEKEATEESSEGTKRLNRKRYRRPNMKYVGPQWVN